MQVLDKLSYKELVKVYLTGQYDQLNTSLKTLDKDNIYSYLIKARLLIVDKKFIQAEKLINKLVDLNINKEDTFLTSEIQFTKGRLNYLTLKSSRQYFLTAAAASLKNNEIAAFVRSRLNAMLDLIDQNNWIELDTDSYDVHAKLIELNASESEMYYSQIKYFQIRSNLAQNNNQKSYDLYLKATATRSFINLPQSDKNNFHLYAIESLIYLGRSADAAEVIQLIENENLSVKNSVLYFKWLMNITDNQSAKKIIFQIENLNESLREKALFFINMTKGQNHGTLSKDYQLKLWSTGSSCYYLDKLNKLFQIKFCHNYMENSVKSKIINLLQKKCVLNGN